MSLINYLNFNKKYIKYIKSCNLPTSWGNFKLHIFFDYFYKKEHLAISMGGKFNNEPIITRIHSECLTGDTFFSQKCDCGYQLKYSFKKISKHQKGIIFYLRQEGRGIGLINKIKAYSLQDKGADTIEANLKLGFSIDLRNYNMVLPMINFFNIKNIKLITNNPNKIEFLKKNNISVIERIPLIIKKYNKFNINYLYTKFKKLNHIISF